MVMLTVFLSDSASCAGRPYDNAVPCPDFKSLARSSVLDGRFNLSMYEGIWFQLATDGQFHIGSRLCASAHSRSTDVTEPEDCKCSRLEVHLCAFSSGCLVTHVVPCSGGGPETSILWTSSIASATASLSHFTCRERSTPKDPKPLHTSWRCVVNYHPLVRTPKGTTPYLVVINCCCFERGSRSTTWDITW